MRKRFVKNRELFGLLKASGCVISVSRVCSTFGGSASEEGAGVRLDFSCAPFASLADLLLFAFFDSDTFDLYCWSVYISGIARRDGHQYVQSFYYLPKHGVSVIQVRGGTVGNKEL